MPHVDLNLSVICMKIQDIWYIYSYGRNPSSRLIILLSNLTHPHTMYLRTLYMHHISPTAVCRYRNRQLFFCRFLVPVVFSTYFPLIKTHQQKSVCQEGPVIIRIVLCLSIEIFRSGSRWTKRQKNKKTMYNINMHVKAACSVHGIHLFQCLST